MIKIKLYYIGWFVFSILFLSILSVLSISSPYHGDERHIVETIRLFTENFNSNTIADYPEVTPPLFFIFYAIWAKIFGQSIESLRIFTTLVSLFVWQLLFLLIHYFVKNPKASILLSLLTVINPYFAGVSVYVFTDMLTILFFLISVFAFVKEKLFVFIIFTMFALLCRQYTVIIPVSVIIWEVIQILSGRNINKRFFIGALITLIPNLILLIIWNNYAPTIGINKWIVQNKFWYNLDYINTYITFASIYLLPVIIYFLHKRKYNLSSLFISSILTIFFSQFTIKASAATLTFTDYKTVGMIHEFFIGFFGSDSVLLKLVLFLFLFIGCYVNIELIRCCILQTKITNMDKKKFCYLLWIIFLIVMPISYQVWEKYLNIILPFYAISIYLSAIYTTSISESRA